MRASSYVGAFNDCRLPKWEWGSTGSSSSFCLAIRSPLLPKYKQVFMPSTFSNYCEDLASATIIPIHFVSEERVDRPALTFETQNVKVRESHESITSLGLSTNDIIRRQPELLNYHCGQPEE